METMFHDKVAWRKLNYGDGAVDLVAEELETMLET